MHLFIFKAESCRHRSAFNEKKKLYVFISVYVHVMYCIVCAVCMVVCTVCMWRCVNECVCVLLDQEQDTANFIWTAKGSLLPNESQGMFLVSFSVLLVCFGTLNVVWRIWKWHYSAPTLLCYLLLGGGGLHKAFWKLFTCCLHRQTHICFMLTSSGGIQRAPVSIMDIRRHPACNISAGHSVTLLSRVFVLLSSVIWVFLKQICSWVYPLPVFS